MIEEPLHLESNLQIRLALLNAQYRDTASLRFAVAMALCEVVRERLLPVPRREDVLTWAVRAAAWAETDSRGMVVNYSISAMCRYIIATLERESTGPAQPVPTFREGTPPDSFLHNPNTISTNFPRPTTIMSPAVRQRLRDAGAEETLRYGDRNEALEAMALRATKAPTPLAAHKAREEAAKKISEEKRNEERIADAAVNPFKRIIDLD